MERSVYLLNRGRRIGILFFLGIMIMAGSVFAAPGDRKGPSAEPAIEAMKEDDCGRNGNKPCNELGDSPDLKSEKGSPKKKIVKKAGAAAAAGVAGKKITENIGDKITPGD